MTWFHLNRQETKQDLQRRPGSSKESL